MTSDEAMRASDADFAWELLDDAAVVLYALGPGKGHPLRFVSANLARATGHDPHLIQSHPESWYELFHPEDVSLYRDALAVLLRRGAMQIDYRLRIATGGYRWFRDSLRLRRTAAGQAEWIVGSLIDVGDQSAEPWREREALRFLEAVMDAIPGTLHVKDRNLRYRMVNRYYLDQWGLTADQVIGRTSGEVFGDEYDAAVEERDRRVLTNGQALPFYEVQYPMPVGGILTLWATKIPMFDDLGAVSHIVTIGLDITPLKRAQQALREREAQSRLILDSLPARVALIDADRRHLYANRNYLDFLDLPAEAVLGRTVEELVGRTAFETVRELGSRALAGEVVTWTGWIPYASGERCVTAVYTPNRSADGTIDGYLVFVHDITEQMESRRKVEHIRQLLESIMDAVPVNIHLKDREGRYMLVNRDFCRLWAMRPEDVIGKTPQEVFPEMGPEAAQLDRVVVATGEPLLGFELHFPSDGDQDGTLLCSKVPLKDETGAVTHIVTVGIDITDRKRAEAEVVRQREALYQSEKLSALGALLAGVAHELNNPLSIVVGHAMMLREQAGSSPLGQRAAKIHEAAERCGKIVRTFLAMARQRPLERRWVQVDEVVRASVELLAYELRSDGIEIRVEPGDDRPTIYADPDQLQQVVTNLIINAQQALRGRPDPRRIVVSVTTLAETGLAEIRVRDNGPGVPPELVGRIFEPFFTTKPVGIGTGIGLSVCRGMVESHGGIITYNPAAGGGAAFTVRLPVGGEGGDPKEAGAESQGTRLPPPTRRALIVDDEPEVGELLAELLAREGFASEVVLSGRAAAARLLDAEVDLVVTDIRMPDMDGAALHAWILAERPALANRLIFVTGDILGDGAQRLLAESGCPYIEKPFDPDEVHRAVAGVFEDGARSSVLG